MNKHLWNGFIQYFGYGIACFLTVLVEAAPAKSCDVDIPYVDVNEPSTPLGPIEEQIAALFGNPLEWKAFFEELKEAAANKDAERLSQMVGYPLPVHSKSGRLQIQTSEEFIDRFPQIFGERVVKAIQDQVFDDLFVNYQGCMVGSGEVWFSTVGDLRGIRIISIDRSFGHDP